MKSSELRLGNLVEHGKEVYSISAYSDDMVSLDNQDTTGFTAIKNIKPIPLTEEWLEKFGFEKYTDTADGKLKLMRLNQFSLEKWTKSWRLVWYDANDDYGFTSTVTIKYIHQLQNLFFALTGEELTIKELTT